MNLHYHPDAIIFIRDMNGATIYSATFDEFKADYGVVFPPLPKGAAELRLTNGVLTILDSKSNQIDAFEVDAAPWTTVVDAMDRLSTARVERVNTKLAMAPSVNLIPVVKP